RFRRRSCRTGSRRRRHLRRGTRHRRRVPPLPRHAGGRPSMARTRDPIVRLMAELEARKIDYLRFELPDLQGLSRSKTVPTDKVETYARRGLSFYGGVLGLDAPADVVPGSGLAGDPALSGQVLVAAPASPL